MRTLVMMHSPAMARQLALELENLGEEWQVHWACDMPSGLKQLRSGAVEMLIVDQQMAQIPGKAGLGAVTAHPPLPPPWLLSMGEWHAGARGRRRSMGCPGQDAETKARLTLPV